MTCLPATVTDPIAAVLTCVEEYGGPEWASLAITGLATVVVLFALAAGVGFLLARGGR